MIYMNLIKQILSSPNTRMNRPIYFKRDTYNKKNSDLNAVMELNTKIDN